MPVIPDFDPPAKQNCSDYTDCNTCATGYPSASHGVCYWCPNSTTNKCIDPDKEKDKFEENRATCSRDCSPTETVAPTTFTQCSQVPDCGTCTNTLIPDSADGGYCSWNPTTTSCSAFDDTGNVLHGTACPTTAPTSCTTLTDCNTCSSTTVGNDKCYWDDVVKKCNVYSRTVNVSESCAGPTPPPLNCSSYLTENRCVSNDCAWDVSTCKQPNVPDIPTLNCRSFLTQNACDLNECLWDASKNTCGQPIVPNPDVDTCSYIQSKDVCRNASTCVWDISNSACKMKDMHYNKDEMSLEDMLAYLSNLQALEENLYKLLTTSAQNITSGTGGMTDAEINIIVDQINSLSTQRSQMYTAVASMYNTRAHYEVRMGNTVGQQLATLKLLENEMNKSKQTIQNEKNEKIKTMKMVEINTYFSQEYLGYTYLMQIVALIGALLLATTFLNSYSPDMSRAMFKLITYAGGVYVLYLLIDIMQRRNTNFDEYTFPTAPTTDADMVSANENNGMVLDVSGIDIDLCAGSFCCADGTEWKDNYGCVPKVT
jgi:hypothetical protein